MPTGISLSAEGKILGVLDAAGSYTFSVVCTDAAGTPHTDEVELTLDIEVPASPAVAIYYDGEGTVCQTETPAFTALDCYVFIMLDEQECDCTYGTEFKLQITDVGGVPLVSGTQFAHSYVDYPDNVVLTMGDPFGGLAVSYAYPQLYTNGPIEVVAFGLLLFEDLENLSFDVMANPTSEWNSPVVTHCDPQRTVEEVVGRSSALNYNQQ
ncbi:MAG: hypothetical protein JXB45_10155 [Candidatus Krumholzibacteriota bacterium]|nr:hypothetical protein [Candidatus Krumholzibacteriota bacterium]